MTRRLAPSRRGKWAAALGFAIASAAASGLGSLVYARGRGRRSKAAQDRWFRGLKKPPFNPPNWVFGPVWTTLYTLATVSAYRVWRQPSSPERTRALALWGVKTALNTAWTPLLFGLHRPGWAFADLGALATTAGAYTARAYEVDRTAARLMYPYLAWLGFAGAVNEEIARRNGAFRLRALEPIARAFS